MALTFFSPFITTQKNCFTFCLNITQKAQKTQKCFALQNGGHTDEHRLLFREARIRRGVVLQKLRNVKTESNYSAPLLKISR